jgi:hypothetical protein
MHGFTVYPTGFEFTTTVRLKRGGRLTGPPHSGWHELLRGGPRYKASPPSPADLRIEIVYPDGTRYGNRAPWWEGWKEGEEPGEELHDPDGEFDPSTGTSRLSSLSPMGGSGKDDMTETTFWQSPLPGSGLMKFMVEWQAEAILRSEIDVDTRPILDAAARAIRVWN